MAGTVGGLAAGGGRGLDPAPAEEAHVWVKAERSSEAPARGVPAGAGRQPVPCDSCHAGEQPVTRLREQREEGGQGKEGQQEEKGGQQEEEEVVAFEPADRGRCTAPDAQGGLEVVVEESAEMAGGCGQGAGQALAPGHGESEAAGQAMPEHEAVQVKEDEAGEERGGSRSGSRHGGAGSESLHWGVRSSNPRSLQVCPICTRPPWPP